MEEGDAMVAPGRGSTLGGGGTPGSGSRGTGRRSGNRDGSGQENGEGRTKRAAKAPDLRRDLRDFASGRPQGWEHDDWLNFLESLQNRGHNIGDREAIGLALEKERLDLALSGVKGIGPQKRSALIEKYGTLWALRQADAADIAATGGITSGLVDRIKNELG